MTEEDLEEGITPEIIEPSKELAIKIKEFNLAPTDASFLLGKHEQDFKNVAIWAKKASKIIVTDESQTVIMQEARTGRLFLASIRNEVERNRKTLKEDSLRRGKAIDGVANFIKDLIIPTEEHLKRQEDFVELKKKAEDERILAEAHAKIEADRIAKEEADRKALAVAQAENEKLQKQMAIERAEAIKQADIKQKAYWAEQEKIKKENEAKLAKERAEREKAEAELFAKRQAEAKAEADRLKKEADRIRAEEALLSADDQTKLTAFKQAVLAIKIPDVKSAINKRIIEDAKSHLFLAVSKITVVNQEEE